jgi:DNA-binding MarR family transcriptional regulator
LFPWKPKTGNSTSGRRSHLQPYQLNQQQFSILFEIGRAGKVQQKDMINRLLLEKAHVSKVTKKLHELGLIEVHPHAGDRRSALLGVTPQGRTLIQECQALFESQKQEWFRSIDTDELQRILESVATLQAAISRKG